MSLIAFVPVRCGSKSIPMKNIKDFCGKPLVYWILHSLQQSKSADQIIVATDCSEIKDAVSKFNFNKVSIYDRKKENADNESSTESVILEYLAFSNLSGDDDFILCQATSPFTKSEDIDKAYKIYMDNGHDSLLSCCRIKRFFWDETGAPINYDYNKRPRRQDFKGTLVENGAFYINKVSNIISNRNRISGNIGVYEMPEHTFFELDEEDDWLIGEQLLRKHNNFENDLIRIKLFLTDVDGVLTDAGMYYSENGDELKKFSTYDGMGISFLKKENIKVGILTSENRQLNSRRAEKLGLDFLYQGVKDKLKKAIEICDKEKIDLSEVAYIGDDINDLELLKNVGIAACPANAMESVKKIPGIYLLKRSGGEGAVREFIELIFDKIKN